MKKQFFRIASVALLVAVATLAIRRFYFSKTFFYAGTLEATKVDLSAQISSRIQKVTVQEGARVKKGEELVTLSCEDVRVAQDFAQDNYLRALRLFKSGSGSKEALDQAQSKKDEADVHLRWCQIQSPIQGTVLGRYHEPGEWVSPGTPLLTLADIQDIWAYIYVAQPEIFRLTPGTRIIARLPELQGRTFQGVIVKINSEAEFTPKNVQTRAERTRLVFGVKVSFLGSNQDEVLKPGMTIEAELPRDN
jgi:HlyD family secretion protein